MRYTCIVSIAPGRIGHRRCCIPEGSTGFGIAFRSAPGAGLFARVGGRQGVAPISEIAGAAI